MDSSNIELDEYSFPEIEPDIWAQIREKEDLYAAVEAKESVEASTERYLLYGPPKVPDGQEDGDTTSTIRIELEDEDSLEEPESIWGAFSEIADADWQDLDIPPSSHDPSSSITYPPIYFLFDHFPFQDASGDIEDLFMSGRTLSEAGNLLKKYKRSGSLSVTNIAAPLWCQQKVFYDLAGLQKLGAAKRPTEFKVERKVIVDNKAVTKEVVIKPDKAVYEKREKDTTRGQTIHQILERQVVPERVIIPSKSKEERFALKILEMLTGLNTLLTSRLWREMPVFGFLENIPVNGIIDELQLVPSGKGNTIRLSDTKTKSTKMRTFDVFDSHRLQLMLYKHLLDGLLSPKFNWDHFFKYHKLDPDLIFSDHFLAQMVTLVESNQLGELVSSCRNLQNLTVAWSEGVRALDIRKGKSDSKLAVVFRSLVDAEAPERRRAQAQSTGRSPSPDPVDGESEILSISEFMYNAKEMKDFVRVAMDFWLGLRPITGVGPEEAWKCNSCEYKNDCEWRQEQAVVLSDKAGRGVSG